MKNKIKSIVLCLLLNITSIIMTMEEESNVATALDLLKEESPSNSPRYQTESISTLFDEKQKDAQIIRGSREKITPKYTHITDKIQSAPTIHFTSKSSRFPIYTGTIQKNDDSYTVNYRDSDNTPRTINIPSKKEYNHELYAIIKLKEQEYISVKLPQSIEIKTIETPTLIQLQESLALASNETQTTQEPLSIKQQVGPSVGSFVCINLNESQKDVYQGTSLKKIDNNCYEITYKNNNDDISYIFSSESNPSNDTTHIVIDNLDKLITLPQSINLIFANWPPSSENPLYTCSTITKKEHGTYLITYIDKKDPTNKSYILTITVTDNDLLNRYVTVLTKDMQPAFAIDLKPESNASIKNKPISDDTPKDPAETEEKITEKTVQNETQKPQEFQQSEQQKEITQKEKEGKQINPLNGAFVYIEDPNELLKNAYQGTALINIHDNHYEITYKDNNDDISYIFSSESKPSNDTTHIIINEEKHKKVITLPKTKNTTDENIKEIKKMLKEEIKDSDKNISYKNAFIGAGVAAAIIAILVYAYKYDKLPDIFYQFSGGLSNLLKKILPSGSTS